MLLKKTLLIIFAIVFVSSLAISQEKIRWRTWEEVNQLSQVEPKKVIVDVYTDWCKVCKKMDKYTYVTPNVVAYINKNYYAIKFDAEYPEDIMFDGKEYEFVGSKKRGYHQLAAHILNGQLRYPTTVFLDESLKVIQAIPGYLDSKTMMMITSYFGDNHYKTTLWKRYEKSYKNSPRYSQPVNNKN